MKLVSIVMLLTCVHAFGNVYGQRTRINVKAESLQLTRLLKVIEKKSNCRFVYRNDLIPADRTVSLDMADVLPEEVLDKVLLNTGLTYKQLSANLIAIAPENTVIADIVITGRVVDPAGHPMPGVTIRIAGLNKGTATQSDGRFKIEAPSTATLVFTFIGYGEQRIPVNGRTSIDVIMKDDAKGLNEFVVVAYGTQSKASLTGSATTVKSVSYDKAPRTSFQESLQGNVPGVQSTNGSGQPGSVPSIRIRGIGSITAGSAPLYVVDGVPVVSGDLTSYNVNSLAGINSADIESITVLKDAASASIYGSRAANGVILITTKNGKAGRTKITASVQQGINNLTIPKKDYPLNTSEMIELLREGWMNASPGNTEATFQNQIKARGIDTTINTDWVDALTRNGNFTQANLSASGGNEKTKFYASGGYYESKAALRGVDYKRMTGKLNLTNQTTNRLSFDVNLAVGYQKSSAVGDAGGFANPVRSLVRLQPWLRVYNDDGTYDFSYNSTFNPVAVINNVQREGVIYNLLGGVGGKYKFSEDFAFETKLSLDLSYARSRFFYPPNFGDGRNYNGYGGVTNSLWNNWVFTNIFRYNHRFGVHGVSAFVGYESQKTINTNNSTAASNFLPDMNQLAGASKPESASSTGTSNSLTGLFLNASYDYNQKYYLTASIRRDASSRFGSEKRSANFWSVGLAWNVYKELFLMDVKGLDELKLRASYGSNGNQAIDNFASLGLYSSGADYDGRPGYVLSQFPNKYLTWEQNKPFNVGIDFAVLKNRLSGTVEYYERTTSRLLLNVPVSSTNGVTTVFRNNGEMKNSGIEVSLSSKNVIPKKEGGFSWNTDFNISTLKNTITKLDNPMTGTFKREVGQDFYQYYLVGYAGVDPKTGEALWYKDDSKTSTTNVYGQAGRFYQGSALPKFYGGLTNTFSFRRFDLSFQLYYNWGNKVYDSWGTFTESDGSGGFSATAKMSRNVYKNRWQHPGDITDVPKVTFGGTQTGLSNQASSRFLYDGSYIRLRDITIGYNLPTALIRKARISDLRIYARANNLWTYVKDKHLTMDPETPVTGDFDQRPPVFRTFLVGLDLSF
ncbi:SusC/RagA family TonB-linked outer membrane protein [Chitinophaga vietnamensis]|uniref:SusC/RagA family TonB-linked outer membrane protein n=1 Tax=Chitinophaga vietnamensis TaxID=2593957 RepID=UPI0013758DB3|nr:SusC/RagA family TonB-linked outer membrane protein [Chitinophaga vietnamensis]